MVFGVQTEILSILTDQSFFIVENVFFMLLFWGGVLTSKILASTAAKY